MIIRAAQTINNSITVSCERFEVVCNTDKPITKIKGAKNIKVMPAKK